MQPVGNGVSGGKGKRARRLGVSVSERKLLLRLCKGIEAQTEAISALARSNEALVQAMCEQENEDGPTSLDLSHL